MEIIPDLKCRDFSVFIKESGVKERQQGGFTLSNNENKNIEAANPQGIRNEKTRRLVMLALWAALTLILGLVPNLGYITIGPFSMTTVHIPVIIGAIMLGPEAGAFLGLLFGLTSVLNATFTPIITAFLFSPFVPFGNFWSLVIAIVPRVLVGVVAAYVFRLVSHADKKGFFASLTAGLIASLTNTILVLSGAYIFFGPHFASVNKVAFNTLFYVLLGVVGTNGIPEAIGAAVISAAVTRALFAAMKRGV